MQSCRHHRLPKITQPAGARQSELSRQYVEPLQERLDDSTGVPGGGWGWVKHPPPIPKTLPNRAKLNLIVKTIKNC